RGRAPGRHGHPCVRLRDRHRGRRSGLPHRHLRHLRHLHGNGPVVRRDHRGELIMDPNATLAEIRALIERWQAAGSRGPWTEAEADQLIEKVADLDKWLTRGGFLPDPWATPDRVTTGTCPGATRTATAVRSSDTDRAVDSRASTALWITARHLTHHPFTWEN